MQSLSLWADHRGHGTETSLQMGRSVGFDVWEGMCADIIWMSSQPVPNMSARQWSLPTVDNTSGLILRLCLWCSLSVAHTEFLSISQTHTQTRSDGLLILIQLFAFLLHPFISYSFSLPATHLFPSVLSHFLHLSPALLIFPREVYLFNTPQQQPFPFACCCWLDHRTFTLDHI